MHESYLDGLSSSSRRTLRSALNQLAGLLDGTDADRYPWHELRANEVRRLRALLVSYVHVDELAPSTVNKRLSALRGVLHAAQDEGHMPAEETDEALEAARNLSSEEVPAREEPPLAAPEQIRAFIDDCLRDLRREDVRPYSYSRGRRDERLGGHHRHGARDAALVALGYGCGLKPGEVRALTLEDVSAEARRLTVGLERRRTLFLCGGTRRALRAWLGRRPEGPERLFFGLSKYGEPIEGPLSQQGLSDLLRRRQYGPPFSFEALRRTFVARLKEAGVRAGVRTALLGLRPRSPAPDEDELRTALELVDVPFGEAL